MVTKARKVEKKDSWRSEKGKGNIYLWMERPWNPTIFDTYIICWLTGSMGRTTHQLSVWCSKHYFFAMISYRLRAFKTLYFYNWNDFCKEFCKKLWKKKLEHQKLGQWVVRPSDPTTKQPSILYWRLMDF